ncbi:cyclin-like protein [Mrakia frigida]|uniref:cyclin n=1 Tax=Mrakia frigida TaxID=29902 RepID=UPI003FCC12BD
MLFEDEYREDVICYMREQETSTRSQVDLMDMQPELQWYMRPYLVEFLVEIHQQFRLRPEVLYLSLNIVDRYVSKRVVFKKHYQLVGCAALWIAAKYEDSKDKVPTVEMLRDMCCAAYDESAFLQMEGHVLSTIGWNLSHPTAESWLRLSCMGTSKEDAETQHVARFVMELTLFHKEFVAYLPSAIAGGALLLARHLLDKPRRSLDEYDTAVDVAFALDRHLGEQLEMVSEIVVAKYSHGYYNRASHFVREEYLKGRRFEIRVPALTVNIPKRSSRLPSVPSLTWSRSNSSSSVSSDFSSPRRSGSAYSSDSDMPETPTSSTSSDPFLLVSSGSSSSLSSVVARLPTIAEPVKQSSFVGNVKIVAPDNGYVVQEPRTVFSSLNAKANVPRPALVHSSLPVSSAMNRRFSQ